MKKNNLGSYLIACLLLSFLVHTNTAVALTFSIAPNDEMIGEIKTGIVKEGDNFSTLARRYDIGYYELVEANPGINPDQPESGSVVIVPTQFILPDVPRKGLIINLVEMRLYYFSPDGKKVSIFPVGIGREGWETPLGNLSIIEHIPLPTWHAPESIRVARSKEGVYIPKVVPPGPDNPLGEYAMRLSNSTYLIHGTNDPSGVGRRSSAGCVRMYPEDIEKVYQMAKNGTPVRVINYPYKAGWREDKLYLETHLPLTGVLAKIDEDHATAKQVINAAIGRRGAAYINWTKALDIAKEQQGMPQEIGHK